MKDIKTKRIIGSIVGTIIIALGISIFKESMLGTDAVSGMNMCIAAKLGLSLGVNNLITNCIFFIPQILYGRRYIGLGTIVNGVGCGFFVDFFYDFLIYPVFGDLQSMWIRMIFVCMGVLVIAIGASLYQTADLGVAPYDYLSLGLRDHLPVPYFWCRIFTDCSCAVIGALLGGIAMGRIGIGTVICSLGLGPFIQFFDKTVSQKLIGD